MKKREEEEEEEEKDGQKPLNQLPCIFGSGGEGQKQKRRRPNKSRWWPTLFSETGMGGASKWFRQLRLFLMLLCRPENGFRVLRNAG